MRSLFVMLVCSFVLLSDGNQSLLNAQGQLIAQGSSKTDLDRYANNMRRQYQYLAAGILFEIGNDKSIDSYLEINEVQHAKLKTNEEEIAQAYPHFFEMWKKETEKANRKRRDWDKDFEVVYDRKPISDLNKILSARQAAVDKILTKSQTAKMRQLCAIARYRKIKSPPKYIRQYHWPLILAPAFELDEKQIASIKELCIAADIELARMVDETIERHEKKVFGNASESTIANYQAIVNATPVSQSWAIKDNLKDTIAVSMTCLIEDGVAPKDVEIVDSQKQLIKQAYLDFLETEPIKQLIEEQEAENARREIEIREAWNTRRQYTVSAESKARQAAIDKRETKACIELAQQIDQFLLPHQRTLVRNAVINRFLQNKTNKDPGGRIQWPLLLKEHLEFDGLTHQDLKDMTNQSLESLNKQIVGHDMRVSEEIGKLLNGDQKQFFAELLKNEAEIPKSVGRITETYRSLLGFNETIKIVR